MRWLARLSLYVFVLLVLFFAWVNLAHAGYAALNPPPGFSSGSVGSASNPLTYTRTAANSPWVNGTAVGNVTANVGGRAVTMPAQARMAANAGQFFAAAVRLNPAAIAITGVAAVLAPIVWDSMLDEWRVTGDQFCATSGSPYSCASWAELENSYEEVCAAHLAYMQSQPVTYCQGGTPPATHGTISWATKSCTANTSTVTRTITCWAPAPSGSWTTDYSAGILKVSNPSGRPAQPSDWLGAESKPPCYGGWDVAPGDCWGDQLPNQWPDVVDPAGVPVPTEVPKINPNPAPNPDPNPGAMPEPMRVPTGDPVPIPDTDPQKWEKPWIDIVPSPTPSDPWRVDVRPGKDVDEDPDPLEDPEGTRSDPDKPREEETVSPPADPSLPPVPELYERKYPDGIAGVWATHKDALTSGPLGTFLASLVPGFGVGGCPSFALPNATVLGVAVGGEFSLPCEIWSFVRLVMIISALLLARRLVFGG